jgi:hypothetical protein
VPPNFYLEDLIVFQTYCESLSVALASTKVGALPWAQIIQMIMSLLANCHPTPTPVPPPALAAAIKRGSLGVVQRVWYTLSTSRQNPSWGYSKSAVFVDTAFSTAVTSQTAHQATADGLDWVDAVSSEISSETN